ncbi:MAG: response regulator [Actinomycetota bacterium]
MEQMRVLLVDDEEELVTTLVERLELRGHAAVGVLTGADAIARVKEQIFDVAVLDLRMPGEDGVEIMRRLKRICPGLPIILLTGHMSEGASERGMQAGADDYLIKPVDIDDLVVKLRQAVAASRGADGSSR